MAEKKRQHYVPRMYLRRFLSNGNQFYLFNLKTMNNVGLVDYKNHCYVDYFYGKDKKWETKLEKKENAWNIAISEILSNNFAHIDDLREFAVFQLGRTEAYNDRLIQNTARQYEEYIKACLLKEGFEFDEKKIKELAEQKAKNITNPSDNLDLIERIASEITDLAFVKINYDTKSKLISSDNPVLAMNPYLPPHVGLATIGLVLLFPLDSENLAVFYDDKIYPKYHGRMAVTIRNESEVAKVNALIFANANEIIYSSNLFDKKTYCKNNIELRNKNLERETVSALGPDDNKLIISQQPTIFHNFSFSFTSIDPLFFDIKFDYRDAVIRKYDERWKDKLFLKCQDVFVQMIVRCMDDIDPVEYREGYLRFYNAMLKYWGIDS